LSIAEKKGGNRERGTGAYAVDKSYDILL